METSEAMAWDTLARNYKDAGEFSHRPNDPYPFQCARPDDLIAAKTTTRLRHLLIMTADPEPDEPADGGDQPLGMIS